MLEYFTYKKVRKHKLEKESRQTDEAERKKAAAKRVGAGDSSSATASLSTPAAEPETIITTGSEVAVLDADERSFLERLTQTASRSDHEDDDGDGDGDVEGERPPLPPRIKTPDLKWDSDSESFVREGGGGKDEGKDGGDRVKGKGQESTTSSLGRRLSQLLGPRRGKGERGGSSGHLVVPGHVDVDVGVRGATRVVTDEEEEEEEEEEEAEAARERDEIARVLEDLDQAAAGMMNKGKGRGGGPSFSLSGESAELVQRFVVVLKDLVGGVPTAADDLRHLLDDRDGTLSRGFERLPSGLRKLVAQLPARLTTSLAPELLAAAAQSQGLAYEHHKDGSSSSSVDGAKAAAKALFLPLLTKPSAIVKMLKAIMNALKLRWPAFIGTSAIWSVALFVLLFVLWYCHKRGREVRLGNEAEAAMAAAAAAAETDTTTIEAPVAIPTTSPPDEGAVLSAGQLPPPPIGSGAAVSKKEEAWTR